MAKDRPDEVHIDDNFMGMADVAMVMLRLASFELPLLLAMHAAKVCEEEVSMGRSLVLDQWTWSPSFCARSLATNRSSCSVSKRSAKMTIM